MLIFRLALFFCSVMTSHQILVFKILPGPNRSIVRALFSKRTVCFIARLIKGLSSQYFEDICVLLIGCVCGKCPLNAALTVLSCGPNCNKRTVCYMARLIKRLSSQYSEDICVLLIGCVCGKCPLNTARKILSCGPNCNKRTA